MSRARLRASEANADFQFAWARRIRAFARPTMTRN
jgi:hypothetical protein